MARLTARVEVNMKTAEIVARGRGFTREFADLMGELTAKYARINVTPGSGPGPHPHRPPPYWKHVDTGALRDSIKVRAVHMGFLETAHVFTDLEYGLYLEVGWTNKQSGNHWRYPWLMPALMQARQESADIARSTGRRWFSEGGTPMTGRVNIANVAISGTAWPE